tara:strand:+ start:286 stop:834 length:549 start_codon:yes stop_codon:yes gene_type:complete
MALWGNKDNVSVQNGAKVALNYATKTLTGTGTTFGTSGYGGEGDVIRIGYTTSVIGAGGTYYGDAVIVSVASTVSATIASTEGLSGVAIGGTQFTISQLPKWTTTTPKWSEGSGQSGTNWVYSNNATTEGVAAGTQWEADVGWVGVTTYYDADGSLRVKKETLVAMSGISTGNEPAYPGLGG